MKEIIESSELCFENILLYFKAESLQKGNGIFSYRVERMGMPITLYFFKNNDSLSCYCLETLNFYSPLKLLYLLSPIVSFEAINKVVKEILSLPYSRIEIPGEVSRQTVIDLGLKLEAFRDDHKVFKTPSFSHKVFIRDGLVCFPLHYNSSVSNLVFLDGSELNSNPGIFSSNFIESNKYIALFFTIKTFIRHTLSYDIEEYFYAVFSSNIDFTLIDRFRSVSLKRSLPIRLYIGEGQKEADNALKLLNKIFNFLYPKDQRQILLELSELEYTIHFFAPKNDPSFLPLLETINKINQRLIIYYNGDMAIEEEDISSHLSLIRTETKTRENLVENSISFQANNYTLCIAVNEILPLFDLHEMTFIAI